MTASSETTDRWALARRVFACAALTSDELALLMRVSVKTIARRANAEGWTSPATKMAGDPTGAFEDQSQAVLSQFRDELAEQVKAFHAHGEGTGTADLVAEKNARTLQMMLRNYEKLVELTGQTNEPMTRDMGAHDSELPALRAELARRLDAIGAARRP